jgi:uncharacterized lipoprotein YddW (UPF0748 family)
MGFKKKLIWVTRWDYQKPADVKKIIKNCADYGINLVLFQVRGNGTAFYKSKYEPWAWELTGKDCSTLGKDPGWDPLQTAIEAAREAQIELHAYLNVFPGWRGKELPPKAAKQLYTTHKNWFGLNEGGNYQPLTDEYVTLCPGIPAVRDYLEKVFLQVVKDYAVDGIHLDYVRYYNDLGEYSLDPISIKQFKADYLVHPLEAPELWSQWKRDAVTDVVKRIYQGTKKIRKNCQVSAATWNSYYNGYSRFYQDSWKWMEEGILDFMTPMTYTTDTKLFKLWNRFHLQHSQNTPVYPAIGILWDEKKAGKDYFTEQMKAAKAMKTAGVAIFAYNSLFPKHKPNQRAEKFAKLIS